MSEPEVTALAGRAPPLARIVRRDEVRRFPAGVALLAFALTLLTVPVIGFGPAPGFDVSWSGGLHMALREHLDFGPEVAFTYGPLGFLQVPTVWSPGTGVLAMLYLMASRGLLAAMLLLSLRRSFGPLAAALGTFALMQTATVLAVPLAVLLAGMLLASSEAPPERRERMLRFYAVASGILVGAELLGKFTDGVLVAGCAVIVVALASTRRRLDVPLFLGGAVASLLVLWTATGQPLSNLDDYVLNALRVIDGYSDALLTDDPLGRGQLTVALGLGAFGVVAALWTGRGGARDARPVLVVVWIFFAFVLFRSAFTRQDQGHVAGFFGPLAIALAGFRWGRIDRRTGALAIGLAGAVAVSVGNIGVGGLLWPGPSVSNAEHLAKVVLTDGSRRQAMDFGRTQIEQKEPVSPAVVRALGRHRVTVWPSEIAVAWAYRLDWVPLPTLQSNLASTPALDALNERRLLAPDGPDRVLVNGGTYSPQDVRLAAWDQPRTTRSLLCHFRPAATSPTWVALARGPSRCGDERLVGSVTVGYGTRVVVPEPSSRHALVSAHIVGLQPSGAFERVRRLVYKGRLRDLTTDAGKVYRLTPAVAGYGLVLRSSCGVDYAGIAAQVPQVPGFTLGGSGPQADDPTPRRVRVDFYERDIAPTGSRCAATKRPRSGSDRAAPDRRARRRGPS